MKDGLTGVLDIDINIDTSVKRDSHVKNEVKIAARCMANQHGAAHGWSSAV
jgi:hypothetical protein